ncbi:NAD(P)/FAD-dependent oxidoreductase [Segnochrobactrum spirostomi]|uniref:FAD-binding oxidoreductase n=1 Tax=Segnochrobactrum spirostomi TaxID=2608987 RepID=A0A6A7Y2A2_9HYPH|nr:FAD-binding oxidoreductase [Segnochrobactrum spirostomi]MQT12507.1 FAD-binding oxidoreductase [Segnochrobactrum spirostomi]
MAQRTVRERGDTADRHAPSYYAATAGTQPAFPTLAASLDTDVCIVGAGFTGLSAALHLARRGTNVTVIDQASVGWGASGRNGGQAGLGWRKTPQELAATLGRDAAHALWDQAKAARAHLLGLVDEIAREEGIDCAYRPGIVSLRHKPGQVADAHAHVEVLRREFGHEDIFPLTREEGRKLVGSDDYHGGYYDRAGGHVHTLRLAYGMARRAVAAGATIYERTPALDYREEGDRVVVRAPRGEIRARHLLVAGNGYLDGFAPAAERKLMPLNNFIITTEPLGEDLARSLIANDAAVVDGRFVVYYFRLTEERRLLFGGGETYGYSFPADIAGFVRGHMLKIYPQLSNVRIDHAWGGTLAITTSRLPLVRRLSPRVTVAAGYSGKGVVIAPWCGKVVADAISGGDADLSLLARFPVLDFPGGKVLRSPLLVAAMTFYALRDRLG